MESAEAAGRTVVIVTLALSALFGAAVVIASTMAVTSWRRRREANGFLAMAVIAIGATYWSLVSSVTLVTRNPTIMWVVVSVTFVGTYLVVSGWWMTAKALTNRFWHLERRAVLLLSIEPLLFSVGLATNPWHHLIIDHLQPTMVDGALAAVFGPLVWIHSAYCYILLGYSTWVIFRTYIQQTGRYRGYLLAGLAALPSLTINGVVMATHGRLIDLTAVGFALSAPAMHWVVNKQSAPALAPVAHREVFENMSDVVIILDRERQVVDRNPAAERVLATLLDPAADRGVPEEFLGTLERRGEHLLRDAGGHGVDWSVQVSELRDRRDLPAGWVLVARDVTVQNRQRDELVTMNEQLLDQLATIEALRASLAEQAFRDHLTGLHNRRHLMAELDDAIASGEQFAVVLADIDHFKQINDQHGHNVGDEVLVHVAKMLSGVAVPGDTVARYGGEEFAIILRGITVDDAEMRVDELRRAVGAHPLTSGEASVVVSFSAGVAAGAGDVAASQLLHAADLALYVAKENGRNRVERARVATTC